MPGKSLHIIVQTPRGISLVKHIRRARAPPAGAESGVPWCTVLPSSAESCKRSARSVFMKIVIAGGTGFLGSPLAEMYAEDGHDVRVLTRVARVRRDAARSGHRRPGHHACRLEAGRQQRAVGGGRSKAPTRVINLAGESIGAKRWTPERKARLRDSRILATRSLAAAIARGRGAAGRLRQRQRRRLLRPVRRPAADRERSARHRFPGAALRGLGDRKRARPNGPARASSCSARASSSSDRAARCRR